MKTRKSVSRRIKVTGSGKLMRRRGFGRHLKATKSKQQKRGTRKPVLIEGSLKKKLKHILGV